jgi:hypothetical protein
LAAQTADMGTELALESPGLGVAQPVTQMTAQTVAARSWGMRIRGLWLTQA